MQKFEGISFLWALAFVGVLAIIYGLRAVLGYRQVARDAEEDFDFKSGQGMVDKRLSRDGYIRAYKRFYAPRSKAYIAWALGAILVLTAPALALINFLLLQVWKASGNSKLYEPGFFLWQFMIFFAVIATWALIFYVAARRYHARAPLSFRRELVREYGED